MVTTVTPQIKKALDLIAKKTLEDETTIGSGFPYVTHPDGSWDTMSVSVSAGYNGENWSHGNWFCGFWVGLLLTSYLHTGNEKYLKLAADRMVLVEERASDGNTHDIGFIFLSSAMPFYRITSDKRHRETALRAADKLRSRLVVTERGSYVSSWGPMDDPRGRAASAIDTMANIPLLYWAAKEADDASFRLAAEEHAKMTMLSFNRQDNTQFHAVEYDTVTGDRRRGYTFQGAHDNSYWSRGTGWAVMGLAVTAANSKNVNYLNKAIEISEKWFEALGDRVVPPYDFDAKGDEVPEDSAASAIMAAGLLDIADLHPNESVSAYWRGKADFLMKGLCENYLANESEHRGILKHGCYSEPHKIGPDAAVMFGDHFFAEALNRMAFPGKFIEKYEKLG